MKLVQALPKQLLRRNCMGWWECRVSSAALSWAGCTECRIHLQKVSSFGAQETLGWQNH